MKDEVCVHFLQWCLPRLHKRWPGFRKVRGQVCKRIDRRLRALALPDVAAYRRYLDAHPEEWTMLDALCRITISRFYRDRGVFDKLGSTLLPALADHARSQGEHVIRCWSAGCASGEEVYTLKILWDRCLHARHPDLALHVTATDADAHMLERARRGCYPAGTLKELPQAWRETAFVRTGEAYRVRPPYREGIAWRQQDIREEMPEGPFHLVLCRNLVFTYFDEPLQRACLTRMLARLQPGGALVLGKHESLPEGQEGMSAWSGVEKIYQKRSLPAADQP